MDKILKYMSELSRSEKVVSNIVQAGLWKNKYASKFKNIVLPIYMENFTYWKNKYASKFKNIVLPIYMFLDDLEVGNALGSQAGVNKFSAIYTSIACLPPHIASRLNIIILTCLLYIEDKKACGNEKVFKELIQELNYFQTKGITVTVNKIEMNVKFQLILILGDNLGLNQIFGFTESFNSNYWCLLIQIIGGYLLIQIICKANSNEAKKFTSEETSILRTVKNYEEDCQNISNSSAGIKEPCVFHKINDFHILENISVDLMHDVIEGVCRYVMQLIIHTDIFKKQYFTLQCLNAIIKNFPLNSIEKYK